MSYEKDISELVRIRDKLAQSKILMDLLVSFFRVRATSEKESSNKIDFAASETKCKSLSGSDCLIAASIGAMQVALAKRSEQSRQFHVDVTGGVIDPLLEVVKRHSAVHASAEKDATVLLKTLESVYRVHDEALLHFQTVSKNVHAYISDCKVNVNNASFKVRSTLAVKAGHAAWEASKSENSYHSSVNRVNEAREFFFTNLSVIMHQLCDIERERTDAMQEAIEKFFIFEVALNRNNQYDNEKSFVEIQKYAPSVHIESTTKPIEPIVALDSLPNSPIHESSAPGSPTVREIQSVEKKVIDALWASAPTSMEDLVEAMKESFSSPFGRVSFCQAISDQPNELSSIASLKNLGRILTLMLDLGDSDSARRVAAFAQKFFAMDEDGKKNYLQAQIYHHNVWNRVQFWEEALLLCIMDELVSSRVGPALLINEMTTIDTFGSHILVFGINPQSARDIANRVIDRNFTDKALATSLQERLFASIHSAEQRQARHVATLRLSSHTANIGEDNIRDLTKSVPTTPQESPKGSEKSVFL